MKIKEIIQMTAIKSIGEIAEKHLSISEKQARSALKDVGCYHIVGEMAWRVDEVDNPSDMELSIYDIHARTKKHL